jgi:hypothetical protein
MKHQKHYTSTSGQLYHITGNAGSVGEHMAKIANYGMLLLPIAIFAIGLSSTFSGAAFADDQDGQYSHTHATATWNPGLVCGDHKCAPGEMSQNPPAVTPVKGIN